VIDKPFRWTIYETPAFVNSADKIWGEKQREAIVDEFATYAPVGDDQIPESDGCWKSRKPIGNIGKRSGARVIYWIDHEKQRIFLLVAYRKSNLATIPGAELAKVAKRLRSFR